MKKSVFADAIILLCVGISAGITGAVVYEYHRLNTVMPAEVIGKLLGLWGGELLTIAVRQILGSDVFGKRKAQSVREDDSPTI